MEQIKDKKTCMGYPSMGEHSHYLPEVEDNVQEGTETVAAGYMPAILHMGQIINTHEFTDEEKQKISKYPTEAFLDGRFAGILKAVGCHCNAG